jgi:hypothetical protein
MKIHYAQVFVGVVIGAAALWAYQKYAKKTV